MSGSYLGNQVAQPTIKNPWLDRHYALCVAARAKPIKLLFLGDSITEAWATHGMDVWNTVYAHRDAANFGISGERVQNLIWRVMNGVLEGIEPRLIVILIGTNNVGRHPLAHLLEGYRVLIREINLRCPSCRILLLGVFPREREPFAPRRLYVQELNEALAHVTFPENVCFLNIGGLFLDEDDKLPPRLFPDGLHPGAEVYSVWAEQIEPIVRRYVD